MKHIDNYVIILFNGYNSTKIYWDYAFENKPELRKIDFLDNLKKIGKTYTFNQPFFNIRYYLTENNKEDKLLWREIYEKYKPYSSYINFNIEDLDYKNICKKIYDKVKKKYGNNKKYIVIGHSYGGGIALLFSKLYKNDCALCCCIDNTPYVFNYLNYFKKYNEKNNSDIIEKYSNNTELKKSLKLIKNSKDLKEKNKEINDIYKLIQYRSSEDNIKYYDTKLYVPTVFFRAYTSKPKDYQCTWFKNIENEKNIFKRDTNLKKYINMDGAGHYIWDNQEFSDIIIETMKSLLK